MDAEHFWQRLVVASLDECWIWPGAGNSTGYGSVSFQGRISGAHRVAAYLLGLVETVAAPKDRKGTGFILHSCDNRRCCNPTHMEIGTYARNQSDAYLRKRREAPKGEFHANAKLADSSVRLIRRFYAQGVKQADLAALYGVSQRVVSLVVRRESYTNVSEQ